MTAPATAPIAPPANAAPADPVASPPISAPVPPPINAPDIWRSPRAVWQPASASEPAARATNSTFRIRRSPGEQNGRRARPNGLAPTDHGDPRTENLLKILWRFRARNAAKITLRGKSMH